MADTASNYSPGEADHASIAECWRQAPAVPVSPLAARLSRLSLVDRQRVRACAEDRLVNAIMPLHWHLERKHRSRTHHAVPLIIAAAEEARGAA